MWMLMPRNTTIFLSLALIDDRADYCLLEIFVFEGFLMVLAILSPDHSRYFLLTNCQRARHPEYFHISFWKSLILGPFFLTSMALVFGFRKVLKTSRCVENSSKSQDDSKPQKTPSLPCPSLRYAGHPPTVMRAVVYKSPLCPDHLLDVASTD